MARAPSRTVSAPIVGARRASAPATSALTALQQPRARRRSRADAAGRRARRNRRRSAWRAAGGVPRTPKPSSVRHGASVARPSLAGLRRRVAFGRRRGLRLRDDPAQHVDEQAGHRQVRPGRVGGDVEEHDQPLAAPLGGDERRAVGEPRPGLVGEAGVRLGQHLPGHGHLVGRGEAEERARRVERRDVLRRLPRERAAEQAAAAPQRRSASDRRRRRRAACRRSAAARRRCSTKLSDRVMLRAGRDAHVGEHQHRRLFGEQRDDRIARRSRAIRRCRRRAASARLR